MSKRWGIWPQASLMAATGNTVFLEGARWCVTGQTHAPGSLGQIPVWLDGQTTAISQLF